MCRSTNSLEINPLAVSRLLCPQRILFSNGGCHSWRGRMSQAGLQKVFIFLGTIFHFTNFLRNGILIFNHFSVVVVTNTKNSFLISLNTRRIISIDMNIRDQSTNSKVIEADETTTGVEMHKDSRFSQSWQNFKDSNPVMNKFVDYRFDTWLMINPMSIVLFSNNFVKGEVWRKW